MEALIMKKILLYNYCLSIYFSRGKKDLLKKGTWFLFSSELFCFSISIVIFLLSLISFKLSGWLILILLVVIWVITFYGSQNWLLSQLEKRKIEQAYTTIENVMLYRLIGLLLYFGSFFFFLIIGILTFQGYLI